MRKLNVGLSTLGALAFIAAAGGTPVSAAPISPVVPMDVVTELDDVAPVHYRRYGHYRPYYRHGYRYRPYYRHYYRPYYRTYYRPYYYRPHYYSYGYRPYYGYGYGYPYGYGFRPYYSGWGGISFSFGPGFYGRWGW